MKLNEIFEQLMAGEFSQLSLGGQEQGVINEANYDKVVAHINLGLASLYRRFHLKEGRITLALQPNILTYPLKSDYAVANRRSHQPLRYIMDTQLAPFKDDITKVTKVLTGRELELPLNDVADELSCFTPTMTTLVVPKAVVDQGADTPSWLRTDTLTVVYRAAHPAITVGMGLFDPNRVEVELPPSHLEALLWFVASRVNNPVGMGNEFNAGNTYAAKYERACQELEALGLDQDQIAHNTRAQQKGFV